jgi:hypothetical protein
MLRIGVQVDQAFVVRPAEGGAQGAEAAGDHRDR